MKEFTPGSKELAGMKANIRQLPAFAERFVNPPIVRSVAPTPVEMLVNWYWGMKFADPTNTTNVSHHYLPATTR
jgi:hypothetical protein